ncbi:MAG TPA: FAD-dependent oxidoreductase, partial [Nocardioides sp.]|nr:FAD-dependent oxidoreductase [Nocardioides sp.]
EDDARLVTTIARTAAAYGAHVRTRARVLEATGTSVVLRDETAPSEGGGATTTVTARAVVNAAGVWAGGLVDGITLRPSRGTHLVLRGESLPGLTVSVFCPVPGETNRFVMVLPQPDGTVYVGLTDEPVDGEIPDVPEPSATEIGFLLDVVSAAFSHQLHRTDVVGAFAGLRPLLDLGENGDGARTADLSRRHAVVTSSTGVVTVVGGKLTTYRRMAQDAVDAAVAGAGAVLEQKAGPCRTRELPLLGAAPRSELAELELPARLVRRYGTDAALVLDSAREVSGLGDDELLAPVAEGVPVTLAELLFGVTHEGAADVDDLLDRRTRVGLVPADRELALPAARRALEIAAPAHR